MSDTVVTVQTVIDQSLSRAKDLDKTNDRIDDAQMLIYLNKGARYAHDILIQQGNNLVKNTSTITLVADTQEYLLLDDFWSISENEINVGSGDPLTAITTEDKQRAGSVTTDTAPSCFYVTSTHIGILPIPTASSISYYPSLYCTYFKRFSDLALTDNMPYKNVLNDPIITFVDNVAAVVTEVQSAEYTALYNALEQSIMGILSKRDST